MEHCLSGICNYSVWAERLAFRGHIPISPLQPPGEAQLPAPPIHGPSLITVKNMPLPVLLSFVLSSELATKQPSHQGHNHYHCVAVLFLSLNTRCSLFWIHAMQTFTKFTSRYARSLSVKWKLLNSYNMSANNVSSYPESCYYTVTSCANKGCEQVNTHLVTLWWKNRFGSAWESTNKPFISSVFLPLH